MEHEGGAIALSVGLLSSQGAVGRLQAADNGSAAPCGWRVNPSKQLLYIPVLIGKGKRGPDLFEGCGILPSPKNGYWGARGLPVKQKIRIPADFWLRKSAPGKRSET